MGHGRHDDLARHADLGDHLNANGFDQLSSQIPALQGRNDMFGDASEPHESNRQARLNGGLLGDIGLDTGGKCNAAAVSAPHVLSFLNCSLTAIGFGPLISF